MYHLLIITLFFVCGCFDPQDTSLSKPNILKPNLIPKQEDSKQEPIKTTVPQQIPIMSAIGILVPSLFIAVIATDISVAKIRKTDSITSKILQKLISLFNKKTNQSKHLSNIQNKQSNNTQQNTIKTQTTHTNTKNVIQTSTIGINAQDKDGFTKLHLLIDENTPKTTKEALDLLDNEPSILVNLRDNYGRTALTTTLQYGNKTIFKRLLQHPDIDLEIRYEDEMMTILHFSTFFCLVEFVQELINKNIDLDAQDREGLTALHYAARQIAKKHSPNISKVIMQTLLDAGADETIQDDDGKTAQQYLSSF